MAKHMKIPPIQVFRRKQLQPPSTSASLAADFIGHSGSMPTAAGPQGQPHTSRTWMVNPPTRWGPETIAHLVYDVWVHGS